MNKHENSPEFQLPDSAEFAEVMHDRLLEIMQAAEQHELFDPGTQISDDGSEKDLYFSVAGFNDREPIMILDSNNELRYVTATIYLDEEYSDIDALGRDADGEPAAIMQLDPSAELQSRKFRVLIDTYDNPGCRRPESDNQAMTGHEKYWLISYDFENRWQTKFWTNFRNQYLDDDNVAVDEPSKQDIEEFAAVLLTADLLIADADNSN